jgi:hypothetical protein
VEDLISMPYTKNVSTGSGLSPFDADVGLGLSNVHAGRAFYPPHEFDIRSPGAGIWEKHHFLHSDIHTEAVMYILTVYGDHTTRN